MDELTKKTKRLTIGQQILKIGDIDKKFVEGTIAFRKRLNDINTQSANYTNQYIEELTVKARSDWKETKAKLYEQAKTELEKLGEALQEIHSGLSPSERAALNETVSIIKNVGSGLKGEAVQILNADFDNNQPALKILQQAYKAAGVVYDGGLDKKIYSVENLLGELDKHARGALLQDGFWSAFTENVEKLATFESFHFKPTDDPERTLEAMFRGAGLPVE